MKTTSTKRNDLVFQLLYFGFVYRYLFVFTWGATVIFTSWHGYIQRRSYIILCRFEHSPLDNSLSILGNTKEHYPLDISLLILKMNHKARRHYLLFQFDLKPSSMTIHPFVFWSTAVVQIITLLENIMQSYFLIVSHSKSLFDNPYRN